MPLPDTIKNPQVQGFSDRTRAADDKTRRCGLVMKYQT